MLKIVEDDLTRDDAALRDSRTRQLTAAMQPAAIEVLAALAHTTLTTADVADVIGRSRQTASNVLGRLHAAGLVVSIQDPTAGRVNRPLWQRCPAVADLPATLASILNLA